MGNPSGVERIEPLDEKEKAKRVQLPYEPLIERSDIEYWAEPSFKLKSATTSTIQKAPIPESTKALTHATDTNKIDLPNLKKDQTNAAADPSIDSTTALGYEIVRAIQDNEEIVRGISDILMNNIKGKNKLIVELSKEEQEKLNELLKQLYKKENVDTVKSILNVLTASSAIVAGSVILAPAAGATVATGTTLWGVLLIASGVTNLISNEVLPRIDGHKKLAGFFTSDENKKQDLADNIQTATSITSTILSIISAIATSPKILGSVLEWGEKATQAFDIGLGLASGGANLVKDIGDHQFKNVQAEQTIAENKLKQEKTDLENAHSSMKSALDVQKAFNDISAKLVDALSEMSQKESKGKTSNPNIQMEIANTAAESIRALNTNLSDRFVQIFKSRLESQEATLNTAKAQKHQAWPHGFSAVVSLTCSLATGYLKAQKSPWAQATEAIATAGPKGADFFSYLQNKNVTIEGDRSKSSDFDKQTKNNTKDNIGSSIARTVEISSRLIQAAGAA
jgi:hypothetical protein